MIRGNVFSRIDQEQRRALISAVMLSLLFFVTLLNDSLMKAKNNQPVVRPARMIASESAPSLVQRNPIWQKKMIATLSADSATDTEYGSQPSSLDHLIYGVLAGRYSVRTFHGTLQELNYVPSPNAKPEKISDPKSFLSQNDVKSALPFRYETVVSVANQRSQEFQTRTYALLDHNSHALAQVQMKLDPQSDLLSLKIDQ